MNMSDLISDLKMDTGLAFISLPIDNFDERIMNDVVIKRTLKTFNQFFPQSVETVINISNLHCIKEEFDQSTYELTEIDGRPIITIDDVSMNYKHYGGAFYDPVGDITLGTYGDMMMAQASANLASLAMPPFTFKYEHPGLLHLYNISTIGYEIRVKALLGHAKNLSTIKYTQEESFYELALLDFKRFLYNSLKYFDKIDTVHGTIDLKIDEYQNAENERNDLIKEWSQKYHFDRTPLFYI